MVQAFLAELNIGRESLITSSISSEELFEAIVQFAMVCENQTVRIYKYLLISIILFDFFKEEKSIRLAVYGEKPSDFHI